MDVDSEKLIGIHDFLDGMTKKEVKRKMISLPKWMIQGTVYGTFLAFIGYTIGAMALNLLPGLFPVNYDLIFGALGFIGAEAIAYTNDITQE